MEKEHQDSNAKTTKAYRQSQHSRDHLLSKGSQVKIVAGQEAHPGSHSRFLNLQFDQSQCRRCQPLQCLFKQIPPLSQLTLINKSSAILSSSKGKARQATSSQHREQQTPYRLTRTNAFLPRTVYKARSMCKKTERLIPQRLKHSSKALKRKST